MKQETLDQIRSGSLTELLVAIDCGELTELTCLCDESIRSAAAIIASRFSIREQLVLFRKLCSACVATTPTAPTGGTTPIGTTRPVPPLSKPAEPIPLPIPKPGCSTALPPANSATGGTSS